MKMADDSTLALVAKSTSQAVIVTDAARIVTWVNPAFTAVTGYRSDEVIGCKPESFLYGQETCRATLEKIRLALESGQACREEIQAYRKDGSPYWIVLNIDPIFGDSGELRGYIGVSQDITYQKQLENELIQRQAELGKNTDEQRIQLDQTRRLIDTIVKNAPMGIIITDKNDIVQIFNPAAEKALGYRAEEIVGKSTPAIFHDPAEYYIKLRAMGWEGTELSPKDFSKIRETLMQHVSLVDEWTYRRKDGSSFPALLAVAGLRDEKDQVIGFAGMFADISRQRRAEEQIRIQNDLRLLLGETASKFINLPLDEVEPAIEEALGKLGALFGVDRAYVFKNAADNLTISNTHEWCAPGITAVKDELQNMVIADFQEWDQLQSEGKTLHLPDVPAMPPTALKEVLAMQEIKSMVAVPMRLRGTNMGFVGFDSVRKHRIYTEDEQALLAHFARMLVNIRMRRESEEALFYSEQRLQNVIDSAGEFIWETDAEGNLIYLSSRAEQVFGMTIRELLGRKWRDFCTVSANKESVSREIENHLQNGTAFRNLRLLTQNAKGDPVHLLLNGRRSSTSEANPGMIGLTLDITQEIITREELEKSRSELARFFEMSQDLVCIVDQAGRFVKVNKAWEELLETGAAQIEGTYCLDYIHPDDAAATRYAFQRLAGGQTVNGFVNRYRNSKGEYRKVEWFSQFKDAHIFASARDVTERENTRLALQRALEKEKKASMLKANLLSMASHEFRTPLASIRIAAELLHRYGNHIPPEQSQKSVTTILERTDYMTEIINDVLDLQRIGMEASAKQESEVELVEFIEEIISTFCNLDNGAHEIIFVKPEENLVMTTRPNLLQRIIGNLVQNALKYSPEKSQVIVECRLRDPGCVEISVKDQGIGVPVGQTELLFEPFFRASNTIAIKGSGLGLSICQSATECLQGKLMYEPNAVQGSIFKLILPLTIRSTSQP